MKKLNAYTTYLIFIGASEVLFQMVFAANMIYQVVTVQLNPLQLVLVGTMLEATVFLFEVPTGVVADAYSRRLSILIGVVLIGIGFIVEGAIARFEAILLAQFLWGIGYTFTSGATQAWISDEIGEARAGQAFLRAAQIENLCGVAGLALGAGIGSIAINLPIVASGVSFLALASFLILWMPERGFHPKPRENRNAGQHMFAIFMQGVGMVQRRPMLLTIFGTSAIYAMFTEGFDRLWTAHMLLDMSLPTFVSLPSVVWFALLRGIVMLLSVGAIQIVRKRLDTNSHISIARTLFGASATLSVTVIAFAFSEDFIIAAITHIVASLVRALFGPIYNAWVNQKLNSEVRATVISMSSQVDALGQIAGGPAVGTIGNAFSIRAALIASGIILVPVLWLYMRTARDSGSKQ